MAIANQDKTNRKNLLLLIQLRWLAVGGQVATILFVHYGLGITLPLLPMSAVILFLVGLNVVSLLRHRNQSEVGNTELFLELLLDVAALTVQLYLSAVLLEAWSTGALVVITSCCFVWLTTSYRDAARSWG